MAGLNLTAACEPHLDAVLANSVCHTTNPDSQAVLTSAAYGGPNNVTLRNVTAVSQGPDSEGVYVQSLNFAGGSSAVTMINTIADGVQSDVFVAQDTQPASLTARYSNFETAGSSGGGTVNDDGTNQRSSPPLFANPATGDFHQAPSSPTIDAGVNEAENGPSDFDGDARVVNGRTDIGADEVVLPPSVTTGSATVDDTSATLTGVVNPNGAATTYRFEYGTDTSYGSSTPETSAGSSGDPQAVQATITGLQRGTTYHYRLVAANHLGTTTGADQTFSVAFLPGRCANLFNGTAGADVLTGTAFGDRISGLAGNDRLQGIGGGDCLFGGAGRDTLDGGVGRDTLRGGGARDKLNGGGSNDVLSGRSGNDVLSGGTGADRLSGGSGPDKLNGGAGPNRYSGGGGNDSIVAANGRVERVNCGSGHDKVRADARDRLRRCEDVRRLR